MINTDQLAADLIARHAPTLLADSTFIPSDALLADARRFIRSQGMPLRSTLIPILNSIRKALA